MDYIIHDTHYRTVFLKRLLSIYKGMWVPIKLRTTYIAGRPLQDFPFASQSAVDVHHTTHNLIFIFKDPKLFFIGTFMVWKIIKKTCMVLKN